MQPTSALARAQKAVAALITFLVFLLAVLAGRFLYLGDAIIETHGFIGIAVFALAVANVGMTLALRPTGVQFAVAGLIALLSFTQVGLGYVGRETADAAALHIPNGVLLMGLAAFQYSSLRSSGTAQVPSTAPSTD